MSVPPPAHSRPLRLMAVDPVDLKILSAAVQDAVAQVGDIRFDATARHLVLLVNRFRWEGGAMGAGANGARGGERVRAALQLSGVLSVKAKGLRREPRSALVVLMSIDFQPGDLPAGTVTLTFSGGGELACAVECIDAMLADVSDPWPTPRRPVHPLD